MIAYNYTHKPMCVKTIEDELKSNGSSTFYAIDINCTEDGTKEYSNISGECFLFDNNGNAVDAYNEILSNVVVTECSIFDISLACYNISADEVEFPLTLENLTDLYATIVDSDNEIINKRILGKDLED